MIKFFNLRTVVAIAIYLAAITMFSACDKDDDKKGNETEIPGSSDLPGNLTFGVTMDGGNVVRTISVGDLAAQKTTYMFKNDVLDQIIEEVIWNNAQYAQISYNEYKEDEYYDGIADITLNGNTIKIVYNKSYYEYEDYKEYTVQQLYDELKEAYDLIYGNYNPYQKAGEELENTNKLPRSRVDEALS